MEVSPLAVAAFAAMMALGGCAATTPPPPASSLYERLGGLGAISAVVDDGVANIAADPRINRRFDAAAVPRLKGSLVEFVCARTGGPCVYRGRNMADAHEGMYIRDEEFNALVQDLVMSLDKFKVPAREQGELLVLLERMRNAIVGH